MATRTMTFTPKENEKREERAAHALEFIAECLASIDTTLQAISSKMGEKR
jgi:hypothetical protein